MATAPAMKTIKIQGEQTSANRLSFSKPRTAKIVKAAPMAKVRTTQPTLFGRIASRAGTLIPKAKPMAVADTEIMAPARMQ